MNCMAYLKISKIVTEMVNIKDENLLNFHSFQEWHAQVENTEWKSRRCGRRHRPVGAVELESIKKPILFEFFAKFICQWYLQDDVVDDVQLNADDRCCLRFWSGFSFVLSEGRWFQVSQNELDRVASQQFSESTCLSARCISDWWKQVSINPRELQLRVLDIDIYYTRCDSTLVTCRSQSEFNIVF